MQFLITGLGKTQSKCDGNVLTPLGSQLSFVSRALPQDVFARLKLSLYRAKQGALADGMTPGPCALPDDSGTRTLTVLTFSSGPAR